MNKIKNKRFHVVLLTIGVIFLIPLVYKLFNLTDIELVTSVIGGLTAVCGVYLGGQSLSDGAREWRNNDKL